MLKPVGEWLALDSKPIPQPKFIRRILMKRKLILISCVVLFVIIIPGQAAPVVDTVVHKPRFDKHENPAPSRVS